MLYLGKKLEVKQFVSCTPLEYQNLPVTPLLKWPPSSAGQCCLTFLQLIPKTACSPPRTSFAVSLWRRSDNGVSSSWNLTILLLPKETGLAAGWGNREQGLSPKSFAPGQCHPGKGGRAFIPTPYAQLCWWAPSSCGTMSPCSLFRGKKESVMAGRERREPSCSSLPSCPSFSLFGGAVTTALLWHHHLFIASSNNAYSVFWTSVSEALPGREDALSLIQRVWNLRVNNSMGLERCTFLSPIADSFCNK